MTFIKRKGRGTFTLGRRGPRLSYRMGCALPAILALSAIVFILAACDPDPGGGPQRLSACQTAIAKAAAIDPMQDTVSDLDQAIRDCESLDEFAQAAEDYPDALDGASAATFVGNRCEFEESLADTAICHELST